MTWKTIFLALTLQFVVFKSNSETYPVVNPSNEVSNLTLIQAVQIYSGKLQNWPNGDPITVILLPRENYISREFILDYLGMSPYQFYESVDISIKLRKNNNIIRVCCEHDVVKRVNSISGSIGYTSAFVYYNYQNQLKTIQIK